MTKTKTMAAVLGAVLAWLTAAAMPACAQENLIRGTAAYREKIALPPRAVLEVRLEDVTAAEAPPEVLKSLSMTMPAPPASFELPYEPAQIEPGHRYRVSGRILVTGEPWFTTAEPATPFDDGRAPGGLRHVALNLVRVPLPPAAEADAPPGFALTGTYWKLVMLNGTAVGDVPAGGPEMHIVLGPADAAGNLALSGFCGCNRIDGSYEVRGAALSIAPGMALTRMACAPGPAAVEGGFMQALHDTARWRAFRGGLELLDAQGIPLARFMPRELQ